MTLQFYSQWKLSLTYEYSFFINTKLTSHKKLDCWHIQVFCLNIFSMNFLIIIYQWALHFSIMPTHYDHSSSYPQSKCSKSRYFPILHWNTNACISSTCCTIMCRHQNKTNAIRILFFSLNMIYHAFFLLPHTDVKFKKIEKRRMKICS
jgi:hypothetical protein